MAIARTWRASAAPNSAAGHGLMGAKAAIYCFITKKQNSSLK